MFGWFRGGCSKEEQKESLPPPPSRIEIEEGRSVPDFELNDVNGSGPFTLSDETRGQGKRVVLVFLRHLALDERKEDFARLHAKILLVSFVGGEGARRWREEVGVDDSRYPFLLDADRTLYTRYGLERSAERAWRPSVLFWYGKQKLQGKRLHKIDGDPDQLGGDFIIDKRGVCILAHRSDDPLDRPSAQTLIDALENAEEEEEEEEEEEASSSKDSSPTSPTGSKM